MQIGDKKTTATITDECPGCPYGGLDLTRGLFQFFAPLGTGVLSGNWYFADEEPEDPKPQPTTHKPKPTTTWKPDPPKTTTHHTTHTTTSSTSSTKEHTSTSHSSTHSSTHSSSASSSAASSSSVSHSSGTSSGLVVPTGAVSAESGNVQNILTCNELLVNMGGLVVAGAKA